VALSAVSPLLFLVMLVVLLTSRFLLGQPVLFRQLRAGLNGRPFVLYKFRSMREERDSRGVPLADELRLTRYGRFLRATSLDELPGFLNVLKGEMHLIGPRPLPVQYTALYNSEQAMRLTVMPGIAGYAALFGRNAQSWESLFAKDVWYVRNLSLLLDLKIIFGVIRLVLSRKGIDRGAHDIDSPFADAIRRELHSTGYARAAVVRERTP
jgi:sugar transferase EpsL